MRRVIGLVLLGILAALTINSLGSEKSDRLTKSPTVNRQDEAEATNTKIRLTQHQVELRNEGIQNVGWVAGNAKGHPIWPQVRGYVTPGGSYYTAFVHLSSGQLSDDAEALANVRLYNEWVERGSSVPFNEREGTSRIRRMIDIAEELKATFP